jgi:hypothetical protein
MYLARCRCDSNLGPYSVALSLCIEANKEACYCPTYFTDDTAKYAVRLIPLQRYKSTEDILHVELGIDEVLSTFRGGRVPNRCVKSVAEHW